MTLAVVLVVICTFSSSYASSGPPGGPKLAQLCFPKLLVRRKRSLILGVLAIGAFWALIADCNWRGDWRLTKQQKVPWFLMT